GRGPRARPTAGARALRRPGRGRARALRPRRPRGPRRFGPRRRAAARARRGRPAPGPGPARRRTRLAGAARDRVRPALLARTLPRPVRRRGLLMERTLRSYLVPALGFLLILQAHLVAVI